MAAGDSARESANREGVCLAMASHELVIPQHLQLAELVSAGSGVFIY